MHRYFGFSSLLLHSSLFVFQKDTIKNTSDFSTSACAAAASSPACAA